MKGKVCRMTRSKEQGQRQGRWVWNVRKWPIWRLSSPL